MKYIKILISVIIVLLIAVSFMFLKKHTPMVSKAAIDKSKVVYINYFSDSLSGGNENVEKNFNEKSKEYQLVTIPIDHESFKTSIIESLKAKNPPDIYSYWAGARTKSIIDDLEPIDDIWQSEGLDKVFPSNIANSACTYKGKKYLIPITQHYVAFFYNKSIFNQLGLTPPKTWGEFLNVCEKIKKAGIIPIALGAKEKWPAQFWFDYILLRTAPFEYRERLLAGEAEYSDKEVRNAFKIWNELIEKGYFNTNPNKVEWDIGANEMVYGGEAAMTLMGTWIIGQYSDSKHNWQQEKDYDFFPFPLIDEKIPKSGLGPIDGLVIPNRAVNIAGAKKVISYMATVENQKIVVKGWGNISPNTNVEKSFYTPMQQRIAEEMLSSENWGFNYDLATTPEISEIGLNMLSQFLEIPNQYNIIMDKTADKIKKTNVHN